MTHKTADWCNANKDEAATITAEWVGIPVEAAKASNIVYTTAPSEEWVQGARRYLNIFNETNQFKGELKGKTYDDVKTLLTDFSFAEKVNK